MVCNFIIKDEENEICWRGCFNCVESKLDSAVDSFILLLKKLQTAYETSGYGQSENSTD